MEPSAYKEYLRVMECYNDNRWNSEIKFNKKYLETDDKEFVVTIKKYDKCNGFSKFVHDAEKGE